MKIKKENYISLLIISLILLVVVISMEYNNLSGKAILNDKISAVAEKESSSNEASNPTSNTGGSRSFNPGDVEAVKEENITKEDEGVESSGNGDPKVIGKEPLNIVDNESIKKDINESKVEVENNCVLVNASWNKLLANTNEIVLLNIDSLNCDGKEVKFVVKEDDLFDDSLGDDDVAENPSNIILSGDNNVVVWQAEWQDDCAGFCNPPEYYFVVTEVDNESNYAMSSFDGELTINESEYVDIPQPSLNCDKNICNLAFFYQVADQDDIDIINQYESYIININVKKTGIDKQISSDVFLYYYFIPVEVNNYVGDNIGYEWNEINQHEDWFLHDADGNRIHPNNGPRVYMMDITNYEYQDFYIDWIGRTFDENSDYDGLFLDVIVSYDRWYQRFFVWNSGNGLYTSQPVNFWTEQTYNDAIIRFINNAKTRINKPIMINSHLAIEFTPYVEGVMEESFVHPEENDGNEYLTETEWKTLIDNVGNNLLSGKYVSLVGGYSGERLSEGDEEKLKQYSLTSYLIARRDDADTFFFWEGNNPGSPPTILPIENIEIGGPIGQYYKYDNVYWRNYSNGVVIVNPTYNSYKLQFDYSYEDVEGNEIMGLTLTAHEGVILFNINCESSYECSDWSEGDCGIRTCTCDCSNGEGCNGDNTEYLECNNDVVGTPTNPGGDLPPEEVPPEDAGNDDGNNNEISSGGGSSGGGGRSSSLNKKSNRKEIFDFIDTTGVYRLDVNYTSSYDMGVEIYPYEVGFIENKDVYSSFIITSTLSDINSQDIFFRVSPIWRNDREVSLEFFNGVNWEVLPTTIIDENNFVATSDKTGLFVITAEKENVSEVQENKNVVGSKKESVKERSIIIRILDFFGF